MGVVQRLPAVGLAAMLLALTGCASSTFTATPSTAPQAAWAGEVRVLPRMPDDAHILVGTLVARGGLGVDEADLIERILEDAAAAGANAVVMQGKMRTRASTDGELSELAAWALRLP